MGFSPVGSIGLYHESLVGKPIGAANPIGKKWGLRVTRRPDLSSAQLIH